MFIYLYTSQTEIPIQTNLWLTSGFSGVTGVPRNFQVPNPFGRQVQLVLGDAQQRAIIAFDQVIWVMDTASVGFPDRVVSKIIKVIQALKSVNHCD